MLSEPLPPLRQLRGGDETVFLSICCNRVTREVNEAMTPPILPNMSFALPPTWAPSPRVSSPISLVRERAHGPNCVRTTLVPGATRSLAAYGRSQLPLLANATLDGAQPVAQMRPTASLVRQPPELEHEPPPERAPRRRRLLLWLRLGQAAWHRRAPGCWGQGTTCSNRWQEVIFQTHLQRHPPRTERAA